MSQKTYTIPAELVSQFEAWGKMTAELFSAIRQQSDNGDQAWFWTEEWQAKEKEADQAIAKGNYIDFENVDDLINELHSHV